MLDHAPTCTEDPARVETFAASRPGATVQVPVRYWQRTADRRAQVLVATEAAAPPELQPGPTAVTVTRCADCGAQDVIAPS